MLPLTPRAEMVLSLAIFMADREESDEVEEAHVLLALLQEGEGVPIRKLIELGFNVNLWLQRLLNEAYEQDLANPDENELFHLSDLDDFMGDDVFMQSSVELDSQTDGRTPTPLLDKYGRDLTAQAAEGKIGPAIAREREIRAVARTLARSKKNNPLLLGDAGVGKTAVVEGLAYAIFDGTAPESLRNRRIVQIEVGTLVAGTSLRGQFEERLIGIVDEARRAGNVILFIDEIHTIVGAGDTIDSNLDAANILKPALARGEIVCIGATTHEEYRRAIAQDPALDRRFRPIDIEEPSEADALAILASQRERLEKHHGVTIRPETLEAAVRLSVRYLPDRRLPDKALDLLDEACARVTIRTASPDEDDEQTEEVRVENIAAVLSEWTGIPVSDLTTDEKRRLADLKTTLLARVVGQDEAVDVVTAAIKTARAGLRDPNRPIGVFLFLGPSGVGKTELARALANFLFGSDDAMLRLDMSEFHDSHTVARLIGAPPGYKDTQRGGQLTDGLRRRPYSVVLLDEVEKAAPEVFDIFLQVFDEGRLSDAHGAQGRCAARGFHHDQQHRHRGRRASGARLHGRRARTGLRRPLEPVLPPGVPEPARRSRHLPPAFVGYAEQDSRLAAHRTLRPPRRAKVEAHPHRRSARLDPAKRLRPDQRRAPAPTRDRAPAHTPAERQDRRGCLRPRRHHHRRHRGRSPAFLDRAGWCVSEARDPGEGSGGFGVASSFGSLDGWTLAEADEYLSKHPELQRQINAQQAIIIVINFRDGSELIIRPNGQIIRLPYRRYTDGGKRLRGFRLNVVTGEIFPSDEWHKFPRDEQEWVVIDDDTN